MKHDIFPIVGNSPASGRSRELTSAAIHALGISLIAAMISVAAVAAPAQKDESRVVAPSLEKPSTQRLAPLPSNCGMMVFDRNAGRMVRLPNVDLVVTHIEITTTSRGTWLRPTIRNNCGGAITRDIHISIGSVVVTQPGAPGNTSVRLGYAVGVPPASSFTVVVDYDERIDEANERNNSCTRATSGDCR